MRKLDLLYVSGPRDPDSAGVVGSSAGEAPHEPPTAPHSAPRAAGTGSHTGPEGVSERPRTRRIGDRPLAPPTWPHLH